MPSKSYAFVHANLIPMDEERVLLDQTVIVQSGHITDIGDTAHTTIPNDAIQIDASNQYIIPALADMHIHLEGDAWNIMFPPEKQFSEDDLDFEQILFPYLANGITTVQVLSALPEHIALRERIKSGEILGPRLILNRMIDGIGQSWPPPINTQVATAEDARQVVIDSKNAGYDGMKVYTFLNQECYDAILATAKELGMPVAGHIPNALSVEHILGAGQNLIAHSEEVMKQAQGDFSPERIDYFAEIIAKSNTWITPTLTTSRKILAIFTDLDGELSCPEMRYLHPMAKGIWSYLIENIYLKMPPELRQSIKQGFEDFQRPLIKTLHEKDVKLMTGTDVLIPTNLPGLSIHEELQELVDIGLPPYEALKASTTHPMEYLEELDETGMIEIEKRTELVLLEANPLDDITNVQKIMGVLCKGQWLDQKEIQSRMNEIAV